MTLLYRSREFVVIRISCGTNWLSAGNRFGDRIKIDKLQDWKLINCKWSTYDLTYLIPYGQWNAFGLVTDPSSQVVEKVYINFQTPIKDTFWGIDTLDLELDLVGIQNVSGKIDWKLKDKKRFEDLCKKKVFTDEEINQTLCALSVVRKNYVKFAESLKYFSQVKVNAPELDYFLLREFLDIYE